MKRSRLRSRSKKQEKSKKSELTPKCPQRKEASKRKGWEEALEEDDVGFGFFVNLIFLMPLDWL